jgi:cytochrome c-type biogenesis protein CcmH
MRKEVRDLLLRGYDEEQILAYFEGAYGEFVRLEPKLVGVNWLVWLAPLAGLLAGGLLVGWTLRRTQPSPLAPESGSIEASDVESRERLPDDPALAEYVKRVREQAYGWPGGQQPVTTRGDTDGAG